MSSARISIKTYTTKISFIFYVAMDIYKTRISIKTYTTKISFIFYVAMDIYKKE
jgi:hypothetical protein